MKVVMVGYDIAPSMAFELISSDFGPADVVLFAGHGKPMHVSLDDILERACSADVVLCGMSSPRENAETEIAALEIAYQNGVPLGLYADTFGAVYREWFTMHADKVNFVFVINEKEALSARQIYKNAHVFVSGNPVVEQVFFPKVTSGEARARLGISDETSLILSPGHKFDVFTLPLWACVADAAEQLLESYGNNATVVIASVHPGDERYQKNPHCYDRLVQYAKGRVRLVTRDEISTQDILPGADIVVTTLSTSDQEAACQRIPVLEFLPSVAKGRLEENFGTQTWEPCELGFAVETNPESLAQDLALYLYEDRFRNDLRRRQEKCFPKPESPGQSVRIIVNAICEIV